MGGAATDSAGAVGAVGAGAGRAVVADPTKRSARLSIALGLNVFVVITELVGGALGHSTGLLADAAHSFVDAAAILLSLIAVRIALRSPTAQRSFGFHRTTILTGLANASLAVAATLLVVLEAVRRLGHPVTVDAPVVITVAAAALGINVLAAVVLRDGSHDVGMRAAVLHMASDALGSFGVVIAGTIILVTGRLELLDPVVSLGIAVLVAWGAWRIARECVEILMESTPADLSVPALVETMLSMPGVAEVHDIHAWSLSSDVRAVSAHVVLSGHPSLEDAERVGEAVKSAISAPYRIAHATLEFECESCVDDVGDACQFERPPPMRDPGMPLSKTSR